jgi:outer membrane lipoprotein-sorting protein
VSIVERLRLVVALTCLLMACARPRATPISVPLESTSEILAAVAARQAEVQTLRARFSATATQPDGSQRRVSGVLLVAKPLEKFRFRLTLPFGITVLDYVHYRDGDWATFPLADGETASHRFESLGLMGLAQAFLDDEIGPECQRSAVADGLIHVLCGNHRALTVRASDATVAEQSVGSSSMRYSNERLVDGIPLPFAIAISNRDGAIVAVEIDDYDVNPSLDDSLFDIPPGAHPLWVR